MLAVALIEEVANSSSGGAARGHVVAAAPDADGLVIGVAVGMGFAALETMGYAFVALIASRGDIGAVEQMLLLRGVLSPAGHMAWTGLACAALWQPPPSAPDERSAAPPERSCWSFYCTPPGRHRAGCPRTSSSVESRSAGCCGDCTAPASCRCAPASLGLSDRRHPVAPGRASRPTGHVVTMLPRSTTARRRWWSRADRCSCRCWPTTIRRCAPQHPWAAGGQGGR